MAPWNSERAAVAVPVAVPAVASRRTEAKRKVTKVRHGGGKQGNSYFAPLGHALGRAAGHAGAPGVVVAEPAVPLTKMEARNGGTNSIHLKASK